MDNFVIIIIIILMIVSRSALTFHIPENDPMHAWLMRFRSLLSTWMTETAANTAELSSRWLRLLNVCRACPVTMHIPI